MYSFCHSFIPIPYLRLCSAVYLFTNASLEVGHLVILTHMHVRTQTYTHMCTDAESWGNEKVWLS